MRWWTTSSPFWKAGGRRTSSIRRCCRQPHPDITRGNGRAVPFALSLPPVWPAPWPGLPSFKKHAAVGTELRHRHAFHALRRGVGHPEIALLVDGRLVRLDEEAGAEILQCLAVGPKFDDRNAVVRFTTVHIAGRGMRKLEESSPFISVCYL